MMEYQEAGGVWRWRAVGQCRPTALIIYLWDLLNLLVSGFAALALYVSTPFAWLRAYSNEKLTRAHRIAHKANKRGSVQKTAEVHLSSEEASCLLTPVPFREQGKMTVVLDLDETLISSHFPNEVPAPLRLAARRGDVQTFEINCDPGTGRLAKMVVFARPGLFEFLNKLSRFAEVVLFTAGVPSYAEPLLNFLDPKRVFFSARLYRDATVNTVWHDYVKDLSRLGRDLKRTVMVDNSPYSFLLQPANGIPCVPYKGQLNDHQLLNVILPLLECLSYLRDIRPMLNHHFKMANWFQNKGCHVPVEKFE